MEKTYYRYGSIVLIGFILFLTYRMTRPFLMPIITSAVIAYIFFPLYKLLVKKTKRENLSALIMCVLVFLIVVLPFFFILNSLVREIPSVYSWVSKTIQSEIYQEFIYNNLKQDFGISIELGRIVENLTSQFLGFVQGALTTVPGKILNVSISAFLLFFFFRDGRATFEKLVHYLPFPKKDTIILLRELKQTADAVVYGQIITAMAQALIATIGYFILGLNAPLFWGIVTLFFSLIPMIGPGIVYVPLSLVLMLNGLGGETVLMIKGIILFVYGVGIVSTVDNIIKPILISDKMRVHPALVFLGVIGGLTYFGVIGILLGPLVLVFLVTLFNIFEMKENILDHIGHSKKK